MPCRGSGDGYGYGDGKEKTAYLSELLKPHAEEGKEVAFWRSEMDGTPANRGSGEPVKVGVTQTIAGPLKLCTRNALHATHHPEKWKGERWWIVRLHEPIQRQDDKIGSLTREIVADLGRCPF